MNVLPGTAGAVADTSPTYAVTAHLLAALVHGH